MAYAASRVQGPLSRPVAAAGRFALAFTIESEGCLSPPRRDWTMWQRWIWSSTGQAHRTGPWAVRIPELDQGARRDVAVAEAIVHARRSEPCSSLARLEGRLAGGEDERGRGPMRTEVIVGLQRPATERGGGVASRIDPSRPARVPVLRCGCYHGGTG